MRALIFFITLGLFLVSCQSNKNRKAQYASVIQENQSLVNQWFGENHFEGDSEKKSNEEAIQAQAPPPALITPGGLIYQIDPQEPLADADSSASTQPDQPYKPLSPKPTCGCTE